MKGKGGEEKIGQEFGNSTEMTVRRVKGKPRSTSKTKRVL